MWIKKKKMHICQNLIGRKIVNHFDRLILLFFFCFYNIIIESLVQNVKCCSNAKYIKKNQTKSNCKRHHIELNMANGEHPFVFAMNSLFKKKVIHRYLCPSIFERIVV